MIPRYNTGHDLFGYEDGWMEMDTNGEYVKISDLAPIVATLHNGQWWEREEALDDLADLVGFPKKKEVPE